MTDSKNAQEQTPEQTPEPTEPTGRIARKQLRTTATPRQVWDAWADPAKIAGWFVDEMTGELVTGKEWTWTWKKLGFSGTGHIEEARPPEYFRNRWDRPDAPPMISEVTIRTEDGMTVMDLVESGFRSGADWDEEYEGADSGWTMALGILRHYLENHDGATRQGMWAQRETARGPADLAPFYRDADALARWLTRSGSIGDTGDPVRLQLRDGSTVTGEVLARSPREVCISWDEIDGFLTLKMFAFDPKQRWIALDAGSWRFSQAEADALEAKLGPALDRLVAALDEVPART